MAQMMDISEIKRLYPDEWMLLGNPDIDEANQKFLSGVVVYHVPLLIHWSEINNYRND